MEKAKYADKILKHYIIMALDAAGVEILPDTYAELDGIITAAIKEAIEEAVKRAKEDEMKDETKIVFGYQESTPLTGTCCICGKKIMAGITCQWNKIRQGKRWITVSVQCLSHRRKSLENDNP